MKNSTENKVKKIEVDVTDIMINAGLTYDEVCTLLIRKLVRENKINSRTLFELSKEIRNGNV